MKHAHLWRPTSAKPQAGDAVPQVSPRDSGGTDGVRGGRPSAAPRFGRRPQRVLLSIAALATSLVALAPVSVNPGQLEPLGGNGVALGDMRTTASPTPTPTSRSAPAPAPKPTPAPTPTSRSAAPAPAPAPASKPTRAPTPGFVTRNGTSLMLNGRPYRFDGVNIYNANSDGSGTTKGCWYALRSGTGLNTSLSDLSGGEAIRAWFFQGFAITNGTRDWTAFDHTFSVAAAHNVKVIVTLGNEWGDCDSSRGYKGLSWYQGDYKTRIDPNYLTTYRQWVSSVVTRYKSNPTILMWQLMNEAEDLDSRGGTCEEASATSALRSFTDNVGGLIHSIDPNHLVDLGTLGSGQCGARGGDYQTVHASAGTDLCEYHDYGSPSAPMPGDQWNGLQVRINQCKTLRKPLFVGETAIIASAVGSYQQRNNDFNAKFSAQFTAGVVGDLIWDWNLRGSVYSSYDVGPGDPALALLTKY